MSSENSTPSAPGIWRKISSLGIDQDFSLEEKKRVTLCNQAAVVGFVLTLAYVVLYFATGLRAAGWVAVFYGCIYPVALLLNYSKHTISARLLLLTNAHLHISSLSFILGKAAGIHFFLFPVVLTPFLFFSASGMRWIVSILFLSFALMTGLNVLFEIYPPFYSLGANVLKIVEIASLITGLMTSVALIYILYIANVRAESSLEEERKKAEGLLLNILPQEVASQLKIQNSIEPVHYDSVTIAFTDFQGFSKIARDLSPGELLEELDACFTFFDSVIEQFELEKLKTIGDSYMYAGGIPVAGRSHPVDVVRAALEIQAFMAEIGNIRSAKKKPFWKARLGVHTGPLVAGVIGQKKFAYDVWGDTVNVASRMESSCEAGRVNISRKTYDLVKDFFQCEGRGWTITPKGEEFEMFFVNGLAFELSVNGDGRTPNDLFHEKYLRFVEGTG